jgi:phage baseplate assembly protein W
MGNVPKDLYLANKEKWVDIDSEWNLDGNGAIKRVFNADAVNASIREILTTRQGERVMRRDFGSGLEHRIFEAVNNDMADFASTQIKEAIEENDDRVTVVDIDYKLSSDNCKIELAIVYNLADFDQEFLYRQILGE